MSRIVHGAVLALGLAALSPAAAQEAGRSTQFGVKGGVITPGGIECEGCFYSSYDLDMSYGIGGFLDYRLAPKLSGGLFLDVNQIGAYDERNTMIEAGFMLKAIVGEASGKQLTWRPAFGLGYGRMGTVGALSSTTYLTIHAGTEVLIRQAGGRFWLAEASLYAAPSGGNEDVTVTFGPVAQLRFGLVF